MLYQKTVPFTDLVSKINITKVDNAEDFDFVMSLYNLLKYSENYIKASGSLWQYYRDDPVLDDISNVFLIIILAILAAVPGEYLVNPNKTLEINCEINIMLTLSIQNNSKLLQQYD